VSPPSAVIELCRYTDSVNEYQLSLQKIQSATVFLRVVQAAIVNTTLLCNLLVTFRSLAQGTSTVEGPPPMASLLI
jgi:ABC-type transport system involved in Fe-S cluster assembly fused permease/ATPase subunit